MIESITLPIDVLLQGDASLEIFHDEVDAMHPRYQYDEMNVVWHR